MNVSSPELLCGVGILVGSALLLRELRARRDPVIVRLKGFRWTAHELCQHVLITGATGKGKTRSGLVPIVLELFKNDRRFGGLCVDAKGVLHETVVEMARHAGRADDVVLLQVGAEGRHRFNLVGDRSIPYSTLARCVVDTAVAMGNQSEQSFFRSAAQIHIAKGLEALDEAGFPVTLENVHNLLLNPSDTRRAMARLKSAGLVEHFEQYLGQPPEQLAGVVGTVRNYLQHFTVPAIAEVFCRDSTFSMRDVDEGRIVCVAMPQLYQTERRFVATFLKLLFFNHALARFDLAQKTRENRNLLVLVADECQQFVTVSEHGMSDHNVIDVLREARVAVIAATQSTTSLVPVLGAERARVYTLNLRHRLIFGASDELDAKASAEFIGRGRKREKTYSWYGGRRSVSVRMVDEFHEKPEKLTQLAQHECILVHAQAGYRKVTLPPLEADGTVSKWYHGLWLGS